MIIPSSLRNRVIKHRASRRDIKASAQTSHAGENDEDLSGGGTVSSAPTTNGYLIPVLDEQGSSAIVCSRVYPFGAERDLENTSNSCVRFYREFRVTQPGVM